MKLGKMTQALIVASAICAGAVSLSYADVVTIETWSTAPHYNGVTTYQVVPRGTYLDSRGRQWTLLDPYDQGLTPNEMSQITGAVDTDAMGPALSGSDVQAGNMGPGNSKGQ